MNKRLNIGNKTGDNSSNSNIAAVLRTIAERLAEQQANAFRINAYRTAAATIDQLDESLVTVLAAKGRAGLQKLPSIGQGIAATIEEIIHTGRSSVLDRIDGTTDPEAVFRCVPGIGPKLAHEIYEALHVDSLQALEVAAHDGRLASVAGIGPRRLEAIQLALAGLLGWKHRAPTDLINVPSIEDLLHMDKLYRSQADAGTLVRIAPARFNPEQRAWLPVLHMQYRGWHYTAMYSNTARAHELQRTHDWVVVYFDKGGQHEGQATVVTEFQGVLNKRRVIRGREPECVDYYQRKDEVKVETA